MNEIVKKINFFIQEETSITPSTTTVNIDRTPFRRRDRFPIERRRRRDRCPIERLRRRGLLGQVITKP